MQKVIVGSICGFLMLGLFSVNPPEQSEAQPAAVYFPVSIPNAPVTRYGVPIDNNLVIEDKIKPNQFLSDLWRQFNVPAALINQMASLPRSVFDVRKVAPDKKYTFICSADSLRTPKAFIYEPNPVDYIVFRFDESLWVDVCQREVQVIEKEISGVIGTTLFHTIAQLGISYELTNRFVDIFAWQVDFQRLQRGDEFKLIYEELQVEGRPIAIQKISGIYFNHSNNPYYAIPFDQGEGLNYFDESGNSLRKALLKYPIEFTRISSRYSGKRFHPVLKVNRPHLGTDFAAPTGTPIRSVGDGIVEEAGYTSNNGNYVKIRHNSTYTTQYLHMSKIAPGIQRGVRVKQAQWIGNVGSTGLATGPHLCYRFWKNGKQVDALKVELPPSQPIQAVNRVQFDEVKTKIMIRLQAIPSASQVILASAL
ncbi:MAG: peptidoglycan DD-metalloendopeptidase family protein [Flammeovirgaceae bacterium]|nr:MAG: peptidoglycan DD-metalloendopeptidase family protein [Flammeovirgaceae bacterium]